MGSLQCSKCGRTLKDINFYKKRNGEWADLCKKCITMHIDAWKPETFVWILEDYDYPWIPSEWNILRDRDFAKKGAETFNAGAVFGKYLGKMKLNHWADKHWADSKQILEDKARKEEQEKEIRERYDRELKMKMEDGEISEAQYNTLISPRQTQLDYLNSLQEPEKPMFFNEEAFLSEDELPDPAAQLSQEDKIYLAVKWGRLYTPEDWIKLEDHYNKMMDSFAIEDADTEATLSILCKINLKMNQAIDCGDIDGALKASRMYDSLRKSSKFTAAQKKDNKSGDFDSVGQIVNFAESKKGGGKIPRHKIEYPLDVIDESLIKLKNYYNTLVKNDPNLSQEIENYIKKREILAEQQRDEEKAKMQGLDEYQLTDEDIISSLAEEEHQKDLDDEMIQNAGGLL